MFYRKNDSSYCYILATSKWYRTVYCNPPQTGHKKMAFESIHRHVALALFPKIVCVDERLFALHQHIREHFLYVRCFDWDDNSWKIVTKIPMEMLPGVSDTQIPSHSGYPMSVFSMRLSSNYAQF